MMSLREEHRTTCLFPPIARTEYTPGNVSDDGRLSATSRKPRTGLIHGADPLASLRLNKIYNIQIKAATSQSASWVASGKRGVDVAASERSRPWASLAPEGSGLAFWRACAQRVLDLRRR
ncbi:hypothetical protein CHELA1G11_13630 [Hyphomicrobiales bacterium]|nr:hypothetical protein CHELA1G2_10684 [Hyphomicrobiales bacterium]CAH1673021.1 hypothetical protein CHELA1G11_13630 [Hyphomicrobiales bacterium]